MNWLFPAICLFGSIIEDIQEVVKSAETLRDPEAVEFLNRLKEEAETSKQGECKKCRQWKTLPLEQENLLVFMSFSVPIESWKELAVSIEKMGGVFVLRGLPGNSFKVFSDKVSALKKLGVYGEIRIDPEAFEKFEIDVVPTVVLLKKTHYDKVSGNIPIKTGVGLLMDSSKTGCVADVPIIRVVEYEDLTFTLDNRRLAAFQNAGIRCCFLAKEID